jgi:hypothetical protein
MNQVYSIGQEVKVKAVKITDGEKSHCFSIGSNLTIAGERNALPFAYKEGADLYLCTDGETDQYLWTSEFE